MMNIALIYVLTALTGPKTDTICKGMIAGHPSQAEFNIVVDSNNLRLVGTTHKFEFIDVDLKENYSLHKINRDIGSLSKFMVIDSLKNWMNQLVKPKITTYHTRSFQLILQVKNESYSLETSEYILNHNPSSPITILFKELTYYLKLDNCNSK